MAENQKILVRGLTKRYGDTLVFENLNLDFEKGVCNVIMGPSGQGKTTLLGILMGLEAADAGSIEGMPDRRAAVFQEDRLCEEFSAVENVALVLKGKGKPPLIREHLEQVGLSDSADKPVCKLSGGMRRRTALVRAILAESEILFLDEPFKGLDEETKAKVMDYFRKQTNGKTVILVTHDPAECETLGDHVCILE